MKYLIHDKIRLGVAVLLCFCTALQTDAKVKLPALKRSMPPPLTATDSGT